MSVTIQSDDYCCKIEQITHTRAAIEGKAAILKILSCEIPAPLYRACSGNDNLINSRIANYWGRARYYNATGRTHIANNGMLNAKKPEIDIPDSLDYMEYNADGSGNSLRTVGMKVTSDLTGVGRYGCLVDMPKGDVGSAADNKNGSFAPHILGYMAEQIFYVREETKNGNTYTAEIRLSETYCKEIGVDTMTPNSLGVKTTGNGINNGGIGCPNYEDCEQVRRLIIIDGVYYNQVWRDDVLYSDDTPVANGSTLDFIPFQFFGADQNTPQIGKITLFDLASVNLGHFVLDADNRDNLHYHGQGMTNVFTNMDDDGFKELNPNGLDVGAKGRNMFGVDDRVEILQIEATGAIAAEMERDEKRMIALGSQTVQDVNTNVTLGAKAMEFSASASSLKQIAINKSEGMEQLLKWSLLFLGDESSDVKYKVNQDFITDEFDAQQLIAFSTWVQTGLLPKSAAFPIARKVGFTDKDDEELKKEIGEQAMGINGTNEERATLMAENDALKEELAALRGEDNGDS